MFGLFRKAINSLQSDASLIARVRRYRGIGSGGDGMHVVTSPEVDDLDYQLMGADNSCARINNPSVPVGQDGLRQLLWFSIKAGSELSRRQFGNSHGSGDRTESAIMDIPKPQYQADPAEVVWHHRRVTALKADGVEQPERVRLMNEERKSRPWLSQKAA